MDSSKLVLKTTDTPEYVADIHNRNSEERKSIHLHAELGREKKLKSERQDNNNKKKQEKTMLFMDSTAL